MKKLYHILTIFIVLLIAGCEKEAVEPEPENLRLYLNPSSNNIAVGSLLELAVSIENVTELFAVSFEVTFDSSVVQIDGVDFLGSSNILGSDLVSLYQLEENLISIGLGKKQTSGNDEVSGDGSLAILFLNGTGVGTTDLNIENVQLIDENGDLIPSFDELELGSSSVVVQ